MSAPDPRGVAPGAHLSMSIVHPRSPVLRVRYRQGILVNPYGFPEWDLCARALVELPPPEPGLTRDEVRVVDVLAANAAMARAAAGPDGDPLWPVAAGDGPVPTPVGWCWAHVGAPRGEAREVALVPVELHGSYRHAGGVRLLPAGGRGLRLDDEPAAAGIGEAAEVPADILETAERLLGGRLPERYRRFLAETNGAGPAGPGVLPGFGFVVDQPLFGLARDDEHQDLSFAAPWLRDRFTVDFLPIGYVQGGLLAVKVSGGDADSIWYWDDDDPRDQEAFDAERTCAELLHRCADSIDEFWEGLVAPAEDLIRIATERVERGEVRQVRTEDLGAGLPVRMRAPQQSRTPPRPDSLTALFEVEQS